MKFTHAAALGLFAFSGLAQAADDVAFSVRIGPTLGVYQSDASLVVTDIASGQSFAFESDDSFENAYGLQTGVSAAIGNFFGDVAVEYLAVDVDGELDRTDMLLTAGYLFGNNWSGYAGYRRGMQGDGPFNDDTFSETGFFVGVGFAGVEMAGVLIGTSLAYNFSEAEDFPLEGKDFDYGGISLKFNGSLTSLPNHSLQLRYQRFNGDESNQAFDSDGDGTNDLLINELELTETYIQLTYLYSF